jgi:hypothetical protein
MAISFSAKTTIPEDVLVSQLDQESVLLHLGSESYFGLREVGSRAWELLTASESIEQAFEALAAEYDIDRDTLRADLTELIDVLVERGLITVVNA